MTAPESSSGNPSQSLHRLGSAQFVSRRRLLLALLVYVVATGGFLAAILALLRDDALKSGAALSRSFAQVIEEQTARTVQSVDHLLSQVQRELRARQAPGTASEGEMRALFRGLLSDLPYVRAIWFIDKEGVIRFDSDEGNIGISLADRPYFAQYRQNPTRGLRLNDPIRSRSTGTWFIPVTRPVYDDAGGLLGVAVASLEPIYLDRVWSASDTDERFAVLFLRRDGTLLMRSPFLPEIMGRSFADRALIQHHLAERPDGTLVDTGFIDAQTRLFAYRALGEYSDLVVIVSRTLDRVLADWRRFAWLTLGGWLAASAALGLIAALLIRESRRRRAVETDLRRLAAERAAVIDALPAHIALLDADGVIVAVNAAWRAFGRSDLVDGSRGGVGANYLLVCDSASGTRSQEAAEVAAGIRAVLQGASSYYALEYPCHSPTEQRWFRLMVAPLPDHDAPGAVVMHVDITDRKQDDQLHAAESRVLEMISTGATLPAVLEKLTLLVEAILPSASASIVLLDRSTDRVRGGAAPHLPAAYTSAIQGLPIGPSAGSCGTAMYRGEQIVTEDIDRDPLWTDYRDLVRPYGCRSCWSTPILNAERQVLASFAIYFREPKAPAEADQRLIDRAVHLARIAIEHHQKDNELRASAQSLRQSEQRFQALANATFDAIWDRDIKANTVWWSEGFKSVFGFTEEEMAERPYSWRKRVHPDDLARILASVEDAMRRRETDWHDEYRFFHRSGRMLYIEDRARFIYEDDGGEPVRLVGGMTDVTSMHEARERIDELQNSLRTLVEAAKIGILVHRDYRPLLANDELARMFGYASPSEILALADCRVLFAPEEIDRISAYNLARRRGGEAPGFYAVKGCRKDGTRIELENRAFTIPWEGEVSVCAMLVDVTDRLALEAQLRQVQRLGPWDN
jgi:PAS domain S-box-containing protein